MNYYRPTIERAEELESYLRYNEFYGCQLTLANVILWSSHYDTYYTTVADMLVFCKVEDGRPCAFSFPVGGGSAKEAFDAIVCYFKEQKLPVIFYLVDAKMYEQIESWYPGEYVLEMDSDSSDYLYETASLATLQGKKLHAKRNHINRFLERYPDYQYEDITDGNIDDCLKLAKDWYKDKLAALEDPSLSDDFDDEYEAIELAIRNRGILHMKGALLRVDGKAIAFTLGSPINNDVFDVHFEKAYADIQGAYAMINREFVRHQLMDYKYINREEDLGIEGLRKAKESYNPIMKWEKGMLYAKDNIISQDLKV